MALRSRTRGWLAAASETALAELRREVERLGGEVGALRSRGEDDVARQQREIETLRADVAALADRVAAQAERRYAMADDLADVRRLIEGDDAKAEQMRLALAGLTDQLRWESDDLRKGLAAIIERVERQRKQA